MIRNFHFKLQPGEENFKLCLQFAWSQVKHRDRYLSVNSHEIRGTVRGICEKLKVNNFHEEEKQFRKIIEETFSHELAVNHYEKDIGYALVSFLIELAYDPITKLKDKKRRGIPIFTRPKELREENKAASDNFISTLLKDNFELSSRDLDSDLSEWTESEDEEQKSLENIEIESQNSSKTSNSSCGLKPPQKMQVFGIHKIENAEKWLKENVQHSWWSQTEVTSQEITSAHPAAHFCEAWQKHLSRKSMGFIKPQPISLLTEYCLLREIFWMFLSPADCKFFRLEKDEISLRKNVSMPSTSVDSLHLFLQDIVKSMNIFYKLNKSIEKSTRDSSLSHTLENYFSIMQTFLSEIVKFLLAVEEIVKEREDTYTIIILYNNFRLHSKKLEILWNVHKTCVIDCQNNLPHIQSTFLLASLNHLIQNAACKEMKNLCIVFLVTCMKTFLGIFNIWWNEARLQDLKNEFIVEKTSNFDDLEVIQSRLFEKKKEKLFFVNDSISKRIMSDTLFAIMNYYATEASFTLEFVSKLDRTNEMRQINGDEIKRTLYEDFVEKIKMKVNEFASEERELRNEEILNQKSVNQLKNQSIIDDIRRGMLEDDDEMMLLVFNSTFESLTRVSEQKKRDSPLDFYKDLNRSTESLLMPLENSIERILRDILEKKISIAEKFVMDIYFNEFMIEQKLLEIRKVYFLDSIELITFFSLKVFPQMELGNNSWANDYHLTTALNEAIGSGSGKPVFTVCVNRKLLHYSVIEAIDEITLHECVNMNHQQNLDFIFTSDVVRKYNDGEC